MSQKELLYKFVGFLDSQPHLTRDFKDALTMKVITIINKKELGNPFTIAKDFKTILLELSENSIDTIFKL